MRALPRLDALGGQRSAAQGQCLHCSGRLFGADAKLGGDGTDQILDLDSGGWVSVGHRPSGDEQADGEEGMGAAAKVIAHRGIDVREGRVDVS